MNKMPSSCLTSRVTTVVVATVGPILLLRRCVRGFVRMSSVARYKGEEGASMSTSAGGVGTRGSGK